MSYSNARFGLLVLAVVATVLVLGSSVSAAPGGGSCSECSSCSSCGIGSWGGNGCSFTSGCCAETGGNCNPQLAETQHLLLKPLELLEVETPAGTIQVARIDANQYMAWSCQEQQYVQYQLSEDGLYRPVSVAVS